MDRNSTSTDTAPLFAGEAWFDPIEAGLRDRVRGFIEEMIEQELAAVLGRERYERDGGNKGYRNGTRERQLTGSFGAVNIHVPRARLAADDGGTREWRSTVLPRYARMTRQVEALIAGAYLAGTNTRRVKRALGALFKGAVGKERRQPDVAQGEGRLRGLGAARSRWRGRGPADPGRHGGAGPAGPARHQHLAAGRARRPL